MAARYEKIPFRDSTGPLGLLGGMFLTGCQPKMGPSSAGQKSAATAQSSAKAGGPDRAYLVTVPLEVTTDVFRIDFTDKIENPAINAIEIIPQS